MSASPTKNPSGGLISHHYEITGLGGGGKLCFLITSYNTSPSLKCGLFFSIRQF